MGKTRTYRQLLIQLLAAVVLLVLANIVVYNNSQYFAKQREYHSDVRAVLERSDVHALFAGDSHVENVLHEYLNKQSTRGAYSLAFGGDSLREVYAKLRYVLDRKPDINTLFVTADPHMFGKGRLESANRSFADWYFVLARDASGLRRGWASTLMNQIPLFSDEYVQFLRTSLSVSLRDIGSKSPANGTDVAWGDLPDGERAVRALETGTGDHAGVGEYREPFEWYQRILDLARERNIRVIGVRFPVHPAYSAQAPVEQVEKIDAFLTRGGIMTVVDLRNTFTDPHSFDDPDHLKGREAGALLGILDERLSESLSPSSH